MKLQILSEEEHFYSYKITIKKRSILVFGGFWSRDVRFGGELLLQTVGDSLQFIPLRPEFKPQTASMEKNRVYRVPSNVNRKFN